jgi:Zn-finger nucleic acid-binding protein
MTDPYRSIGYACPICREVAMREVGPRLVCDSCGGMLIAIDDFTDVAHAGEVPKFIDDGASALECPRCAAVMRGCRLEVSALAFEHALGRCERHGVWFPGGALFDIFAKIGAAGHTGAGAGRTYGGVGHQYVPMYQPRPRPLPSRIPASRVAGLRLACPVCDGSALALEADRWTCARCSGAFVENAALVAMVTEMTRGPWEMPPPHGPEGTRACPVCTLAMQVEELEHTTIDRCPEHGVWFDPKELGDALHHAGGVGHRGVAAWLKRLIHVEK